RQPAPRAPAAPGIGDLDELLQRPRTAGLTVNTRVIGTPQQLPSVIDVAAARIVQESLTNVLRHAPGAEATVTVRYTADSVDITVDNTRPTSATARSGTSGGNGIIGMRERTHALGGALTAGPRPSGGFRVAARLPTQTPEPGATSPHEGTAGSRSAHSRSASASIRGAAQSAAPERSPETAKGVPHPRTPTPTATPTATTPAGSNARRTTLSHETDTSPHEPRTTAEAAQTPPTGSKARRTTSTDETDESTAHPRTTAAAADATQPDSEAPRTTSSNERPAEPRTAASHGPQHRPDEADERTSTRAGRARR
ncbi:ATP-binding protein, partial [Nocardia barduliensis]|uniref:ATP-binding protein n=1 Tax=Nocardia barduliensis TaxID=2736643 RepID=UPI0034D960A2